jgi:GNAT superfamily N-acetyltransferase
MNQKRPSEHIQSVSIVERVPTMEEYLHLIAAVGWRPRERRAVELALGNSLYAVCAETGDHTVGCGRVIGDGGLHLYLTDVVADPAYQRCGVGSRIVAALTRFVDTFPYRNTVVGIIPTPGLQRFYERHGYKAEPPDSPALYKWVNRSNA